MKKISTNKLDYLRSKKYFNILDVPSGFKNIANQLINEFLLINDLIYPEDKLQVLENIFNSIAEGISLGWYSDDLDKSPLLSNQISNDVVDIICFIILKSMMKDVLSHVRYIKCFNCFPTDGTYGISMLCLRSFEEALCKLEHVEIESKHLRRRLLSQVVKI